MIKNSIYKLFIFLSFIIFLPELNTKAQSNLQNFNSPILTEQTSDNIVTRYGQLRVQGNRIVSSSGDTIALRGMSLFWSQWIGKYYNYDCIKWLRDDWKCTVVRAAMAVEEGGYLTSPSEEYLKVAEVIDACIDLGIYVIVDWHDHHAHQHTDDAITFFKLIAANYGDKPNIIYEIYNEPLNTASWANDVKPYADSVIKAIRSVDPDNLILVGSPTWSQDVDIAALNPLPYSNIAYTLHFYAATHKQSLRNKAITAMNRGVALFVSEWGTCEASGTGVLDYAEVEKWSAFMDANKLSWCNWSIADKNETAAALKSGANVNGGWTDANLTASGQLVRSKIISWNSTLSVNDTAPSSPFKFELLQNYPNPFNPETTIRFEINDPGLVQVVIYDLTGKEVALLVNEVLSAGKHEMIFNGSGLSSGTYYCQLKFGNYVSTKKIMMIK